MKEYLLLLRGGMAAASKTNEQNSAEMQAWGAYMGELTQKGQLTGGLPLVAGGRTVSVNGTAPDAVTTAQEGIVGGYLLIKASNLEEATEIAKACPHVANDGNIEVREIAPMPAM